MPTTSRLIESIPSLWTVTSRLYVENPRTSTACVADVLARFGIDFEPDRSIAALRDLAIDNVPLADRVQFILDRRCQTSLGGESQPWATIFWIVALRLDLHPDDVAAHDWPTEWDEVLTHHRDMFRDLLARLARRVPDLAGAMLAAEPVLSGEVNRYAAVSCPTEGEAALVLGSRDLVAADSLVAVPFNPFRSGPGTGRFIIVDWETRSAFTHDDLARCQGRTV